MKKPLTIAGLREALQRHVRQNNELFEAIGGVLVDLDDRLKKLEDVRPADAIGFKFVAVDDDDE